MTIQCSNTMYEAFKAVMRDPAADGETYADLTKNAIEAALLVWHQEKYPRELPILGYLPGGKRIHPCREDTIYTAAVISCCGCHKVIRGMGGPMDRALCPDCWKAAGI